MYNTKSIIYSYKIRVKKKLSIDHTVIIIIFAVYNYKNTI